MKATALLRRIRWMTWITIIGLVLSGVTAIPLETEMNLLAKGMGLAQKTAAETSGLAHWLLKVRDGLQAANTQWPFLAYGTDWLAFGHLMIALVFVGALRDPVKNIWLFDFGLLACLLVIPWAILFGGLRGIPFYWRLIDCSFGIIGALPLWIARRDAHKLMGQNA
jgi:hypothetical protein